MGHAHLRRLLAKIDGAGEIPERAREAGDDSVVAAERAAPFHLAGPVLDHEAALASATPGATTTAGVCRMPFVHASARGRGLDDGRDVLGDAARRCRQVLRETPGAVQEVLKVRDPGVGHDRIEHGTGSLGKHHRGAHHPVLPEPPAARITGGQKLWSPQTVDQTGSASTSTSLAATGAAGIMSMMD